MSNPGVEEMARKTLFYDKHVASGGKLVDFSGWLLPMEYSSILKEAQAARASCALFDVSHMGRLIVSGTEAAAFLQKMTTNDVYSLKEGAVQYSLMLNEQGGVVDDLLVYRTGEEYRCVVNASNKEKVCAWMDKNKQSEVEIIDETDSTALLSLQGPKAAAIMYRLCADVADSLPYMCAVKNVCAGLPCLISRTGYTGEDGFEISTQNGYALALWDKIVAAGQEYGLCLAGLGSRDILRIEAGYPLYGHEIDENINPLDSSLGWVIKNRTGDFIGGVKIAAALKQGPKLRRIGLVMKDRGVPRQGYPVYDSRQAEIGKVTSGTFSPNADKFIGMALIDKGAAERGKEIFVSIRGKMCAAEVVKLPHVPYRHR